MTEAKINYKDHNLTDLREIANQRGIAFTDEAVAENGKVSKRLLADLINSAAGHAESTPATVESNGHTESSPATATFIDGKDYDLGTVLKHIDKSGATVSTVTKTQPKGTDGWRLSTDGKEYGSLSKAANADHAERHNLDVKDVSMNGRKHYGLPSAVGTPREGGVGAPRGKSRDALVARRDKHVKMIAELQVQVGLDDAAIVDFDIMQAAGAGMAEELKAVEEENARRLAAAKQAYLDKIKAQAK